MRRDEIIKNKDVPGAEFPLSLIWRAVNTARVIGPAPFLDMLRTVHAGDPDINFFVTPNGDEALAYLDGFYMYILPMLDGISQKQARDIANAVSSALGLPPDGEQARMLMERLSAWRYD